MSDWRDFNDERRLLKIRYGAFAGKHFVYRSIRGYRKDGYTDDPITPWYLGQTGDWVVGDDGHVCQILKRGKLVNRRGQVTHTFRFAFGSVGYYIRKDGTTKAQLQVLTRPGAAPTSIASPDRPRYGKWDRKKKIQFAQLVLFHDIVPYRAYMKVYKTLSVRSARYWARHMLRNEKDALIQEVMSTQKEIFDKTGLSDEHLAGLLKKKLENDELTAREFKELLQFAHELKGNYVPPTKGININNNNAGVLPAPPPAAMEPRGGVSHSHPWEHRHRREKRP